MLWRRRTIVWGAIVVIALATTVAAFLPVASQRGSLSRTSTSLQAKWNANSHKEDAKKKKKSVAKPPPPKQQQQQQQQQQPKQQPPPVVVVRTEEPIRTIGGSESMIFEMARKMLLWDSETSENPASTTTVPATRMPSSKQMRSTVLPRWRPIRGVSDANPDFRKAAPMMNSQGYAGTIWRNVRKANKPSLWRHALRTYDRMGQNTATQQGANNNSDTAKKQLKVKRTNLHHEGALVACAKLGLWKKALQIYGDVQDEQEASSYKKVYITDNMVLSLIKSCVRASRASVSETAAEPLVLEERRAPLDACREVLWTMEEKQGLPLVATHMNPLAAAYQNLGLHQDASKLLNIHLQGRTRGPEEENGMDPFNVNDIKAKDKGSYSLLVKGAVAEGDWEGAVEALKTMTEAGLYPNARNLNAWTEVSERKTKQRTTRSWKKKRNEFWLESVR